MTIAVASVGLWRNAEHEYWAAYDDVTVGPLPSVTTILKAIDKSGPLVGWAKRATAECAVRNLPLLTDLVATGGPQAAIDWLKRIPDYTRDTAADLGSRVHALVDAEGRGEPVELTDEERPYLDGFRRWLAESGAVIEHSEAMGANLTLGYAGTLDLIVKLERKRWLIDVKTGKGVYAETAGQLAAYSKFEFLGAPGVAAKAPMPVCSRFGVLHLRPEGYRLVEFHPTKATWDMFHAALTVSAWLRGEALTVMEAPRV